MTGEVLSFLTPYWSGRDMMRIQLGSIRQFHPTAPILVSKRGGDLDEMEAHRVEFAIQYWLEDCAYEDAVLRLFERCKTEYVCVLDHDTALLSSLGALLKGLRDNHYDLVGIEDTIRDPSGGWMRIAPGYMDSNFLMFNWREFRGRWGLRGVTWERAPGTAHDEFYYGICQKLKRHKYLLPFHTRKYGMGNLLKDGDTPVLWHQWYGSYRTRLVGTEPEAAEPGTRERIAVTESGERAFLTDYPNLDLSDLTPAWRAGISMSSGVARFKRWRSYGLRGFIVRVLARLRKWRGYGSRRIMSHVLARLDRWRRLL